MALGYVLITVSPQAERGVYEKLLKINEITELTPLFGEYDFIAKVEAKDFDVLGTLVTDKIRTLQGIIDTQTLVTVKF